MLTWTAIKLLLSNACGFILEHWQTFVFVLICLYAWYEHNAYNGAKSDIQACQLEAKTFKHQIDEATLKAVKESTVKQAQSQSKYDVASYIATNQINAITQTKSIKQLTKSIKDTYEAKSIEYNMVHGTGIMLTPTSDSGTTKETASNTEGLATGEPNTDPACAGVRTEKKDLELACAATTAYFNQCRSLLDADTLLYGREGE
jgi:hypothetical protein